MIYKRFLFAIASGTCIVFVLLLLVIALNVYIYSLNPSVLHHYDEQMY